MAARVAEVCTDRGCAHPRVNGDRISFVSSSQLRRYGYTPLVEGISDANRERELPADIVLPPEMGLVHDANGAIFSPCEVFIVRSRAGGSIKDAHPEDIEEAQAYFGPETRLKPCRVEIPRGPWKRLCRVEVIRYTRYGNHKGEYEHRYDPGVWLYGNERPLAFKLSLPRSCIVDERGFVSP